MNPILQAAIGSILRWALALGSGYLVKAGIWTDNEAATYVTAAALAILSIGWSIWEKSKARKKVLVALTMPSGSTPAELNTEITRKKEEESK